MIKSETINVLIESASLLDFIGNCGSIESNIKNLTNDDLSVLMEEYPELLRLKLNKLELDNREAISLACLTLVKRDVSEENYIKLKKVKIYFNENSLKIVKVLQN